MEKTTQYLFETQAIEVTKDTPYWYTSGDFGPFYVNTHYLYGSKDKAIDLLTYIDQNKDKETFEFDLNKKILDNYHIDLIFKTVIDEFVEKIKNTVDINSIDYISGGERRDWFFSIPAAYLLKKKHIFLYKNGRTSESDLENKNILHISDLINVASSYVESWKPMIENINGLLTETFTVVDRKQGGLAALNKINITMYSLVVFDTSLFKNALKYDKINQSQYIMVKSYIEDNKSFMHQYIKDNQNFLQDTILLGGKSKQRAEKFIEKYEK